MRIISKQHDYYDSVQRMAYDPYPTFVRDEVSYDISWKFYEGYFRGFLVGFCGKIYPGFSLHAYEQRKTPQEINEIVYSYEEFLALLTKYQEYDFAQNFQNTKRNYLAKYSTDRIKGFFENRSIYSDSPAWPQAIYSYFDKYKTPIFILDSGSYQKDYKDRLRINALLKDVNFERIFPPYLAFQEISMYLSNTLLEENKPLPKMPDEDMASIKGFNKYSFRKDKQG